MSNMSLHLVDYAARWLLFLFSLLQNILTCKYITSCFKNSRTWNWKWTWKWPKICPTFRLHSETAKLYVYAFILEGREGKDISVSNTFRSGLLAPTTLVCVYSWLLTEQGLRQPNTLVSVAFGGQQHKTDVKLANCNPEWDCNFLFPCQHLLSAQGI